MNYFEILGVTVSSTDEEVRAKYRKKLHKFHPDCNIDADEDDRLFYERMTNEIKEAYEHLKTEQQRKAYEAEIKGSSNKNPVEDDSEEVDKVIDVFDRIYQYIDNTASSNSLIQSISGIAGYPWNLVADAGTIFTHYVPMINRMRDFFGYRRFESNVIEQLVKSIITELMSDVIGDKVFGSIPIIGAFFNYRCAKLMTWRIGILFTIVNSQGEKYNQDILNEAANLTRKAFPNEMLTSDSREKKELFIQLGLSIFMADDGYEQIKAFNRS